MGHGHRGRHGGVPVDQGSQLGADAEVVAVGGSGVGGMGVAVAGGRVGGHTSVGVAAEQQAVSSITATTRKETNAKAFFIFLSSQKIG